jgi:hypothetical protein
MARRKQAKSALPYAKRLVEDEYVHAQLRNAAKLLNQAYRRAARRRGKAVEDKKLYENLREAAGSIRKASLALRRRKPEPKRRGRKLLLVALAGGGAAVVLSESGRRKLQSIAAGPSGSGTSQRPEQVPQVSG